jgi:hypothetical protein
VHGSSAWRPVSFENLSKWSIGFDLALSARPAALGGKHTVAITLFAGRLRNIDVWIGSLEGRPASRAPQRAVGGIARHRNRNSMWRARSRLESRGTSLCSIAISWRWPPRAIPIKWHQLRCSRPGSREARFTRVRRSETLRAQIALNRREQVALALFRFTYLCSRSRRCPVARRAFRMRPVIPTRQQW